MNFVIFENHLLNWLYFILTVIGSYIALKFLINSIKNQMEKRFSKNSKGSISYLLIIFRQTKLFFLIIISIFIGSIWIKLPEGLGIYLRTIVFFAVWIQIGIWVNEFIINYINIRNNKNNDSEDKTTMNALKTVLRIVLWSIIFIMLVDNIPGVQITALITSLGIGGIAIGLALQNILGDLFASLSISLDKPFVIGDLIQVDNFYGTVEKIGLKSTRLRSISGEQLIFSNSDLLNSRVHNFKRLERRRVVITLGVLYQTTPEQLRLIPELIKSIFSEEEGVTLDRVHLANFGDFSINFDLVYWVESADFSIHMDLKQTVLLRIFDTFIEHDIEFAYPTQSLFIENN
ncbi:MAG TPA: mechanosensitive ion channel family protein [Anaerolineaceae bacterium]|nr:mechanosensitive ion channel family protein [Anaerolineaceae bacterium]